MPLKSISKKIRLCSLAELDDYVWPEISQSDEVTK